MLSDSFSDAYDKLLEEITNYYNRWKDDNYIRAKQPCLYEKQHLIQALCAMRLITLIGDCTGTGGKEYTIEELRIKAIRQAVDDLEFIK